MHLQIRRWIGYVAAKHPDYFKDKKVLDVGSMDVNGTNNGHFINCYYIGIDIAEGKNVDYVSICHEFRTYPDGYFDTVISTDMLEHDRYWFKSLRRMVDLTRRGGLLLLTCAGQGRGEHGTIGHSAESSPFTIKIKGWDTYYQNLTEVHLRSVLEFENEFSDFEFREEFAEGWGCDTQFWGIKR